MPKALREVLGIGEGDEVAAEVISDAVVLRPLRPKVVDVDLEKVREVIEEERRKWERRPDLLT